MLSKFKEIRKCKICEKKFEAYISQPQKKTCSMSCYRKWEQTPECRNKRSKDLKNAHEKNPEWAKRSSKRMKENNPAKNPEIQIKIQQSIKNGKGYKLSQYRGGNGRPLPQAQRILLAALSEEWIAEYPISTKMPRDSGYPTCYKVDIGNPQLKIWIELDGKSHKQPERKIMDKKKEDFLRDMDWKGLRFKNKQVIEQLQTVLKRIKWYTT